MLFLINFIFEAGNETREKIWSDFGGNKSEERSEKRVVFVHTAVFESENLMCEKIFSKRANFSVHVRLLKAVFCKFWWLWGFIIMQY